mmetsp:Transcript_27760/g.77807  ORF Transcript_27760/g.77807 Transcript_27760/m.77807 type:complete len:227 (-) Transcript_27760:68-748(-)
MTTSRRRGVPYRQLLRWHFTPTTKWPSSHPRAAAIKSNCSRAISHRPSTCNGPVRSCLARQGFHLSPMMPASPSGSRSGKPIDQVRCLWDRRHGPPSRLSLWRPSTNAKSFPTNISNRITSSTVATKNIIRCRRYHSVLPMARIRIHIHMKTPGCMTIAQRSPQKSRHAQCPRLAPRLRQPVDSFGDPGPPINSSNANASNACKLGLLPIESGVQCHIPRLVDSKQ